MVISLLSQFFAAFLGTIAFSSIFQVPHKYYLHCGVIGGLGWGICWLLTNATNVSSYISTLCATVFVVLCSRICSTSVKCPVTVFLLSGIFPLVPGVGIYWTIYYLIEGNIFQCSGYGRHTLGIAVAIVLGILFTFEIPSSAISKICDFNRKRGEKL